MPVGSLTGVDDSARLANLIEIWWEAVGDFTGLLDDLPADAWELTTDLPGWNVHAIASHIAHVESMLAGEPDPVVEVGSPDHVKNPFGHYMESGVVARRDATPSELIAEIRRSAARRREAFLAHPPMDGSADPDRLPPGVTWDLARLLSNRPIDLWMHEQDVRRAVGRPGNLDSQAADHTIGTLTKALPFVVAKLAGGPPGTTVTFEIDGQALGVLVDERGRGMLDWGAATPDVTLTMTRETFAIAAGGRRPVTLADVECQGDAQLAERILAHLAVIE